MFQVLIIDDEDHMRDSLTKLLHRHCPEAVVIGEASGVESGIRAIRQLHPEIVLLDIQLGDGTGFDILNALPELESGIIFITAFDQYAVQAFRFSAVDYLLKPVNPEMLTEAVGRAKKLIHDHQHLQMKVLQENLRDIDQQRKKIILKTSDNIYLVELQSITCCESDGNYTHFHTSGGENILVSKTLKEYDDMLNGCGFYRVHKSFLINLAHIRRFEKQEGGYIVLTHDLKVPVASRKREEVLALLERMAD